MTIVESNCNFVAIDVGACVSSAVSQVLRKSPMENKILKGRFTIPSPRTFFFIGVYFNFHNKRYIEN